MMELMKEGSSMCGRVSGDDDVDGERFGEKGGSEGSTAEAVNDHLHT